MVKTILKVLIIVLLLEALPPAGIVAVVLIAGNRLYKKWRSNNGNSSQ